MSLKGGNQFKLGFQERIYKSLMLFKNALIAQNTFPYVDKVSKAVLYNKETKSAVVVDD